MDDIPSSLRHAIRTCEVELVTISVLRASPIEQLLIDYLLIAATKHGTHPIFHIFGGLCAAFECRVSLHHHGTVCGLPTYLR